MKTSAAGVNAAAFSSAKDTPKAVSLTAAGVPASAAALVIRVPGVPAPQGSHRAFVVGRRAVVTQDNDRTMPWRAAVTYYAVAARRGRPSLLGKVSVTLYFAMPRPGGHYGSGRNAGRLRPGAPKHPVHKPDLDKLVRACLDALTEAGVWRDDSQVVQITAMKRFVVTGESPGVTVVIGGTL